MNHALCIAVDQYTDPRIAPLQFCQNDARALAQVLEQRYGYDVTVSVNPTASELAATVEACSARLQPEDRLVLSLSGHGVQRPGASDWLMLASDARAGLLEDAAIASLPGVLSLAAISALTRVPQVSRLFVLDTCRSPDPSMQLGARNFVLRHKVSGARRDFVLRHKVSGARHEIPSVATTDEALQPSLLVACPEAGRAVESIEHQHGLFTWGLLSVLRQWPASQAGLVIDEAFCRSLQQVMDCEPALQGHAAMPYFQGSPFTLA